MKINMNIRASISYRTRELQKLLHSSELDFFAKSACSHSFPRGHMTPNNRTVSRQNSPSGQHRAVESMTLKGEGEGVLLQRMLIATCKLDWYW